jgi:carboxynorspermidine decarboxylase
MKDSVFLEANLVTPCYVYDQTRIESALSRVNEVSAKSGCISLYSIKSANLTGLLELIRPHVSGFSCSSLNEVRLVNEIRKPEQSIHITTPGYREDEWDTLIELADYISLNSLPQCQRVANRIRQGASCGLRINPQLSFARDSRFDPCQEDSKLGVRIDNLQQWLQTEKISWDMIDGIHLHNNCESHDFSELFKTVGAVVNNLSFVDEKIDWINLGGGYLFDELTNIDYLYQAIDLLKTTYTADIFIEPGKAITGSAGYLIASVIDLFETENRVVAILDTSINHLPEVFEYQYQPLVMSSVSQGDYAYRLAGSSCLSGDLFGDYSFNQKLEIGSRIIFENVGAYMQVKANLFNGINLPASYLLQSNNECRLLKQHDYESFRSRL